MIGRITLNGLLVLALTSACSGPFPAASKPNLPDDHTESIKGVLHKPGYEYPYKESSNCSDSDCHQDDLDGGLASVDGRVTIAPSCFQCHETLWKDDIEEQAIRQILSLQNQSKQAR